MATPRDAHLTGALALWSKTSNLKETVADSRVLVVGAGGIGCELLKILVLSGFRKIEIVDLDTIDVSNLNRQFLFRREHVGQSKAAVAAKAVLSFNKDVEVIPHHGNIKDKQFGVPYMKQFDIVFNALDNVDARRHVNRICVAAERPLVDGGTMGYLGQVTTICKGKTACYDCQPKAAPKGFPVCTIRSTPDKPIHCVVWAKHLFNLLFGVKDDENSVSEVDSSLDAAGMVRKLFVDDINKLIGMEDLWKVQVLLGRYQELKERAKGGALSWDKDDDAAMDFVLCASNLRANAFGIEMQTSFRCKQMAGNIIPAIATTNAIISGYMVLEAYKVLDKRIGDCKLIFKNNEPTGKKVKRILIPDQQDNPAPQCPVCSGQGTAYLTINTEKTSLDVLLRRVLKQELGLNEPILDTGENMIECLSSFGDAEEERNFANLLSQKLSHPAVGLCNEVIVDITDESQGDVKLKLHVTHSEEMDPEASETFYHLSRSAAAAAPASAAAPKADNGAAVAQDDDDDCVTIEESDAPKEALGKRKRDDADSPSKKKLK